MKKTTLLFGLFLSLSAIGAAAQTSQTPPAVRLGHIETQNATLSQILEFPRLVAMNPTCYVTGFSFSILPSGGELVGPYKTEGLKLTADEINLIKKYDAENTRIFIDDIRVKSGEQELKTQGVLVKMVKG